MDSSVSSDTLESFRFHFLLATNAYSKATRIVKILDLEKIRAELKPSVKAAFEEKDLMLVRARFDKTE